ncbi:NUDIX domain-containing protein [Paenibacillus glucanolyticus]|uniref:NUDIX domain-containing protein n=1 Tax=Paenibacillus glucanolyticus TaxID=59843 RepID=UPI00096C8084|nr:NUDIX domain-containing protein [Paenibacillus glucanolyticus]OMF69408.1 NUDIX hydrolase [Paenibacillus glucanolyticus]
MKPIRNSAKAVIMRNDQILLTKNVDQLGEFYLFPGGGQEKGETLVQAVIRECQEEIGRKVEVLDLLHVREYIGSNHEFAEWDSDVHQVEFYFECCLADVGDTFQGHNPDEYQVGVEWIDLSALNEIRIYPHSLVKPLMDQAENSAVCYVGDTN